MDREMIGDNSGTSRVTTKYMICLRNRFTTMCSSTE